MSAQTGLRPARPGAETLRWGDWQAEATLEFGQGGRAGTTLQTLGGLSGASPDLATLHHRNPMLPGGLARPVGSLTWGPV